MPTYTVTFTDRRDDGHIDPESRLCAAVSLKEALNRIRAYAVQHTEAHLTGVQIVQDGQAPRLSTNAGTVHLVVARLRNERDDQSCPVLLCATRELAQQFIDEETERGGASAAIFAIQALPIITSLAVEPDAPQEPADDAQ